MLRSSILLLCVGSGAAFVAPNKAMPLPNALAATSSPYASEMGALPPVGFFDPLGLSNSVDRDTFDRWRYLEIKHGRISMLAVLGYLVPELFRWPGHIAPGLDFADIPHGIRALDVIPSLGWIQMIFLIGLVDYWGVLGDYDIGKVGSTISQGGILDIEGDVLYDRQVKEIQHGRLAMLAFMELLRQDLVNLTTEKNLDHFILGLPNPY